MPLAEPISIIPSSILPYHRQFDKDIPPVDREKSSFIKIKDKESSYFEQGKRIVLVSLPFFSLWRPAAQTLSILTDSIRSFSSLVELAKAISKRDPQEIGYKMLNCSLAIASIAGTIFNLSYGLIITSGHDIILNLQGIFSSLSNGDYKQAVDDFINLANSSLYLTSLIYGSLEIIILSLLTQVAMNAFRSYREFGQGRLLEGWASLAMTGIRAYQTRPAIQLLHFKWKLEKMFEQKRKGPDQPLIVSKNDQKTAAFNLISQNQLKNVNEVASKKELEELSIEAIFEKACAAIETGDFETVLKMGKECLNWKNLNKETLKDITTRLINNPFFKYGDDEGKNIDSLRLLEIFTLTHPNANLSRDMLFEILKTAALGGKKEIFDLYQEKTSLYKELTSQELGLLIQENGATFPYISPQEFPPYAITGKEAIFLSLMQHNNFDKSSASFIENFTSTIIFSPISASKKIDILNEAESYAGWKAFDPIAVAKILKRAVFPKDLVSSEIFRAFVYPKSFLVAEHVFTLMARHKSWAKLNEDMLGKILERIARYPADVQEIDSVLIKIKLYRTMISHPKWEKLQTSHLQKIVGSLREDGTQGPLFYLTAKHTKWNDLSAKELVKIAEEIERYGFEDHTVFKELVDHPNWGQITKEDLFGLLTLPINRGDYAFFLDSLTDHPSFDDLTPQELLKLVKAWSFHLIFQQTSPIIDFLARHLKWEEIKEKVEAFLAKERKRYQEEN